jgi:hypothetical protein
MEFLVVSIVKRKKLITEFLVCLNNEFNNSQYYILLNRLYMKEHCDDILDDGFVTLTQ